MCARGSLHCGGTTQTSGHTLPGSSGSGCVHRRSAGALLRPGTMSPSLFPLRTHDQEPLCLPEGKKRVQPSTGLSGLFLMHLTGSPGEGEDTGVLKSNRGLGHCVLSLLLDCQLLEVSLHCFPPNSATATSRNLHPCGTQETLPSAAIEFLRPGPSGSGSPFLCPHLAGFRTKSRPVLTVGLGTREHRPSEALCLAEGCAQRGGLSLQGSQADMAVGPLQLGGRGSAQDQRSRNSPKAAVITKINAWVIGRVMTTSSLHGRERGLKETLRLVSKAKMSSPPPCRLLPLLSAHRRPWVCPSQEAQARPLPQATGRWSCCAPGVPHTGCCESQRGPRL